METFESMMESYVGFLRSQAPSRTSRQLASRDIDDEDDYFATRHLS